MDEQIKLLKIILRGLKEERKHLDMVGTYAEEMKASNIQLLRLAEANAEIENAIISITEFIEEAKK